eukprot:1156406-Pelagomonas_calceolata.AAC.4
MKGPVPQLSRQALIPGGSVEINHGNLFGDSQVRGNLVRDCQNVSISLDRYGDSHVCGNLFGGSLHGCQGSSVCPIWQFGAPRHARHAGFVPVIRRSVASTSIPSLFGCWRWRPNTLRCQGLAPEKETDELSATARQLTGVKQCAWCFSSPPGRLTPWKLTCVSCAAALE